MQLVVTHWRRSGQPFVSNTKKETSGHSAFSVTPGDLLFLSRSQEETRRDCDGCIIYPHSPLFYHRKSIVKIPPALPSARAISFRRIIFLAAIDHAIFLFCFSKKGRPTSVSIDHCGGDWSMHAGYIAQQPQLYKNLSKVRHGPELRLTYTMHRSFGCYRW